MMHGQRNIKSMLFIPRTDVNQRIPVNCTMFKPGSKEGRILCILLVQCHELVMIN
jgi:hypothetical protein